MFSSLISFKTLLITLITIGVIKLFSILHRQSNYWKNNGAPHMKPAEQFVTGWKNLFGLLPFANYCKFLYNYYPDARYIGIMDFSTPIVVLRDPKLIKDVTVKYFDHFPDHRSFVTEEMDPIFGRNVFSLKGDRWREMRNTLSPSFTTNKMKFIFELVSKCSQQFVDYLHEHPELCSMMEAKDAFTRYTNDVIASAAFGIDVNSMKNRDNEFYLRGLEASKFTGFRFVIKLIFFRISARMMRLLGYRFLSRPTSAFFSKAISETVKTRREQRIVRPDMIHLLMQAKDENKCDITNDDIVAQAFIFFLAGFDTVSTGMCFVVYELALHQDVQAKLREEVDRYLEEEDGEISYDSLSKMKYMDMVISETLRLRPPALIVDRVCTKKFELPPAAPGYNSVTLNPDDSIWIPVHALHSDPKYFPDPDKFDPERFNEENKHNIEPYTYMPFGMGPRQCIGNRFALMESKILLVHLLSKFVIKPNVKTPIPIVYQKHSFSLVPKDGFWISLEKREV